MSDKKNIFFFIIISFLIFSSRWIPSYYLSNELISIKVIFESIGDGYYYFPLVKYLSIFDFNNSFDPNYIDLDNIIIPFYSIFVHSFFYKFFGSFSFVLIEYFSILIFLLINYKLFKNYYSQEIAILFSIVVFSIPMVFSLLPISDINYLRIIKDNLYSFRFPRPLITSLYLFFFLYLILFFEKKNFLNKKNFFIIGVVFALTLSSFYYFFFIEFSILVLYFIYRYKFSVLKKLLDNWDSISVLLLTFTIISLPLILNILYYESDYSQRLGIIDINFNQKKILLQYFLTGYFKKEFLIFITVISIFIIYINKKKIFNYQFINLFYLFFIASAIAPLLFILITNKTGILYHYNNTIIIFAFILVLIIIFEFFNIFYQNSLSKITVNILSIGFVVLCVASNLYKTSLITDNKIKERQEFNTVTKTILENFNLKESTLMTFDNRFMVWSILNDIRYLNLTNFLITPKKDMMIEDDLINAFKFLNLDNNDFNSFISNKKTSWRYVNYDLNTFFFYKYIANPIKTYGNSKNFNPNVYDYILKTSPINFEQSIIPNEELERLNEKFSNSSLKNFNFPDIVILNKESKFIKKNLKILNYCKIFDKDFFILMFKKSKKTSC